MGRIGTHPIIADDRAFYWPCYRDYLLRQPEIAREECRVSGSRDYGRRATTRQPDSGARHQSKGLVVGYVQSGKTANFTGVVAKAIDAGYRLVIVMTGTIEMLRAQTQRRIDMDLVGRQNIVGDLSPGAGD